MKNNGNKCILIYEDDQEILFLCKTILQKNNYRVETQTRCDTVIEDLLSIQPDLILMDLWIPDMGGEKAISLIKENPETSNIPVVIFSANSDIKEICRKIKADGYLEKPFDISTFTVTIEKYLSKYKS